MFLSQSFIFLLETFSWRERWGKKGEKNVHVFLSKNFFPPFSNLSSSPLLFFSWTDIKRSIVFGGIFKLYSLHAHTSLQVHARTLRQHRRSNGKEGSCLSSSFNDEAIAYPKKRERSTPHGEEILKRHQEMRVHDMRLLIRFNFIYDLKEIMYTGFSTIETFKF